MIEGLSIDPFDSNHWLYGTGATIYGSHDLLKWDTAAHNVTLKSLADGIEETAVQALLSPPTGPPLVSALLDLAGESRGMNGYRNNISKNRICVARFCS